MSSPAASYRTESYLDTVAGPRMLAVEATDSLIPVALKSLLAEVNFSRADVGMAMVNVMLLVESQLWLSLGARTGYFVAGAGFALPATQHIHSAANEVFANIAAIGDTQGAVSTEDIDPQVFSFVLGSSSYVGPSTRRHLRGLRFPSADEDSLAILSPEGWSLELWCEGMETTPAAWRKVPERIRRAAALRESLALPTEPQGPASELDPTLEDLGLTQSVYNTLRRAEIHTLDALTALSPQELLDIRDLGPSGISEISRLLSRLGLGLSGNADGLPVPIDVEAEAEAVVEAEVDVEDDGEPSADEAW